MPAPISVVINTWNAARTLSHALDSVRDWCEEIVVVDMRSADGSAEIARSAGARVFDHEPLGFVEPARSFALSKATSPWILILDADELVPPPLRAELTAAASDPALDAIRMGRLNYFFRKPLRGGGWGVSQDRHVRFFRAGVLVPNDRIHSRLEVRSGARVRDLPAHAGMHLVHFNYASVSEFLLRLDRYTTIEASQYSDPSSPPALLATGVREMLARFLRHGGWRDGWRGSFLALSMLCYRAAISGKVRERLERGDQTDAEWLATEANRWLGPPALAASVQPPPGSGQTPT